MKCLRRLFPFGDTFVKVSCGLKWLPRRCLWHGRGVHGETHLPSYTPAPTHLPCQTTHIPATPHTPYTPSSPKTCSYIPVTPTHLPHNTPAPRDTLGSESLWPRRHPTQVSVPPDTETVRKSLVVLNCVVSGFPTEGN